MTEDPRPAPLVSGDTDINGLDGFMLNVQRLFSSELWALSTGDEFKAALGLWGRAWQQTPAGSLPNDERVLAAFSGAGKDWRKVRSMALRGFVECHDGRLYHRVLCEDVTNAHRKRQAFRERTRNATKVRLQRNEVRNEQRYVVDDADVTSVQGQFQGQGQKKIREGGGKDAADPPPSRSDQPKTKRRRPAKADTPWPDGFSLTDDMAAYARQAGFDSAWLFEKFETKARAKGWEYRDWTAAFRNFATTEKGYTRSNGASQPGARRAPDC